MFFFLHVENFKLKKILFFYNFPGKLIKLNERNLNNNNKKKILGSYKNSI